MSLILYICSEHVTASKYYVSAGTICPSTNTQFYNLSYYTAICIKFTSNKDVVLKSLTIANCEGLDIYLQISISLLIGINIATLEWVLVQNGSGFGLTLASAFDVLITNSSFIKKSTS